MNSQHKQAVVALFLLGIMAMTVVFVYAETVNISKILIEKRTGVRVENQLDEAVKVLEEGVTADCKRISDDVYSLMLLKLKNEEGSTVEALNTGKKAAFYK